MYAKNFDVNSFKPKLEIGQSKDIDIQKCKDCQYELEFKALLYDAMKSINTYNQNMFKAYSFLWEKCCKAIQSKIVKILREKYFTIQ